MTLKVFGLSKGRVWKKKDLPFTATGNTVKRRDVERNQELGFGGAVDEMAVRHSSGDAG